MFGTTRSVISIEIRSLNMALVGFLAIPFYLCYVVTKGQEGTITNQASSCPPGSQQWQE